MNKSTSIPRKRKVIAKFYDDCVIISQRVKDKRYHYLFSSTSEAVDFCREHHLIATPVQG